MKNLWKTFIAIGLVLAIIQAPNLSDAKIIKKTVKELKKLKKYAYLLAANKKKLYAIPFPMPLPVFVKRQHIYTQVPIIPRYVQHPQPYGTPALSADASSNYEIMSGSYAPETRPYGGPSKGYSSSASSSSSSSSPSASSSSSSSLYGARKRPSSSSTASDLASQYLGSSGKYISQIASLLSQAGPMMGNTNRDLISKLISGQARVLPPTSLLSAIRSTGAPASMSARPYGQQEQSSGDQQEQDDPPDSKSHAGSSATKNSVTYDDSTTSKPESQSAAESVYPSASETYKSSMGYRTARPPPHGPFMNPYHFQAMMGPMMSPMAALANRARALRSVPGAGYVMPLMDPYDGVNQIDSVSSSSLSLHDPQEASASSEHESASREYPNAYAALMKQRQLQQQHQQQHQLQLQAQPDQLLQAVQKMQRQQMLTRQQDALKMALIREQEVAARLAESRQILVRAHQLGLPIVPDQSSVLKQYSRQLAMM